MPESLTPLHKIDELFEHVLGLPAPAPDTDLFACGSIGSLEFAELLLKLEDEFGFRISFEEMDMERLRSTSAIAGYLAAHAS